MLTLMSFFTPDTFMEALPYAGKGMLGVFIVIVIIMVCIYLLNLTSKLSAKRKAKKKPAGEE